MQKKKLVLILTTVIMLATAGIASAAGVTKSIKVTLGGTDVTVNDKQVNVEGGTIIYNGQVYAPIKSIAELTDAQATVTTSKVEIRKGTFLKGKYTSNEQYDAAELKVSPLITNEIQKFTIGDKNIETVNSMKYGAREILIPLGKNFSILTFSVYGKEENAFVHFQQADAKGSKIKDTKSSNVWVDKGSSQLATIDVTGYDYILIDSGASKVQFYDFVLTAK